MFDVAQFTPRKFSVDVGPFGFATQEYLQQQDDELFRRSSTCTDMSFNECMPPAATSPESYYVDSYTQFLASPAAPVIDNVKLETMDQVQRQQQSASASQSRIRSSGDAPAVQHKHVCKYAFCGWSFKRYEHLKRHMLVHTGERPHVCHYPGCGKSFSRSDNFHAHCRTHNKKNGLQGNHGRRQSRVSKNTTTTASTSSSLASAAAVVAASSSSPSLSTADVTGNVALVPQADHTGSQQQPLSFDPATADYSNALYDHRSPIYQMNESFQYMPSMQQEQGFYGTSEYARVLDNNMMLDPWGSLAASMPYGTRHSHNGVTTGSTAGSNAVQLKSHVCPIPQCQRRFKRLEHLKRHMRIHTLERPFSCTFPNCHKTFSRSDNLSQHMKTHQRHEDRRRRQQQQQQESNMTCSSTTSPVTTSLSAITATPEMHGWSTLSTTDSVNTTSTSVGC
ncbi:Putative Transcription factor STE12 [Lichtheimia ramosa]|uniref:Putative Transcription factor STE12 n=1 Tax=Lichtheimia ramosa TaxID=688394 RepID=A0A077WUL0_9FUNG|nr:Putative Transcription factor STE12 [Lichtheimia ramosa]